MGDHPLSWIAAFSVRPLRRRWRLGVAAGLAVAAMAGFWHRPSAASARGGTNPHLLWYVPTDAKVVALTFDDGPSPSYTGPILQALSRAHAQATFFVLGRQVERHPDWVRREVQAGMEIGNHTWSHINLKYHRPEAIAADVARTQTAIEKAAGVTPVWMRPPYGAYTMEAVGAVEALGLKVALWSWTEDSRDWANPGIDAIVSTVVSHIAPGDIVLFHDGGGNRSETVAALPIILQDLHAMGYRFVTLSQLVSYQRP